MQNWSQIFDHKVWGRLWSNQLFLQFFRRFLWVHWTGQKQWTKSIPKPVECAPESRNETLRSVQETFCLSRARRASPGSLKKRMQIWSQKKKILGISNESLVLAIMSKWVAYVSSIPTQGFFRNLAQLPNSDWTKMKPNDRWLPELCGDRQPHLLGA